MKRYTLMGLMILAFLAGCATNQFDAQIAASEASIEIQKEKSYEAGVKAANAPKLLVRLDGEFLCSEEQKATAKCGVSVFNPNARSVAPQREENTIVAGMREVKETLLGIAPLARDLAVVNAVGNMVDKAGRNGGDHITTSDSGNTTTNSHSEANQANQTTNTTTTTTTSEDVSGTKAGGDVNQSQQNQANPSTTTTTTTTDNNSDSSNSSVNGSNNEPEPTPET